MTSGLKISSALVSVFNKEGLSSIVKELSRLGVALYSTGGTQEYLKEQGFKSTAVEDITEYPSILGGRVKTLHPKIFGGILNRQGNDEDTRELKKYNIPQLDLVIVDLYPFEATVKGGKSEAEIIEKIDIGGISLIRAAAKNFKDVMCVSSVEDYEEFLGILIEGKGIISLEDRRRFAAKAFNVSSHYDAAIFNYFDAGASTALKLSYPKGTPLRYGENPHQKAMFFGSLSEVFDQLHGKDISYNNLLDVDAAVGLILEFKSDKPTFAIIKHNNACGVATRETLSEAYEKALEADPVSAFGGVLVSNRPIDKLTASQIDKLFFEVVIAPDYEDGVLEIIKSKKNRIILKQKPADLPGKQARSCLTGLLLQDRDTATDRLGPGQTTTQTQPSPQQIKDLEFASKICKHTKSNAIILAKNEQMTGGGVGQTSRVDALKQAIEKAQRFGFDLNGNVMASDAFFPFPDCVDIAAAAGIASIVQPGGSIKDNLSIEACNKHGISMLFTGTRHFKH